MAGLGARRWWWIAGGTTLLVGAAAFIVNEKMAEQPRYRVVEADGAIELRDYPELLVAETAAFGTRQKALDRGFGALARYIFAKDRGGDRIAMTAPVLNDATSEGWRTRFVMPARYTRETLPPPATGVRIEIVPAGRVAAIRFAGTADDAALATREEELRAWLARRGIDGGKTSYAFYNSPFVPGPLRRNEVLVAIS